MLANVRNPKHVSAKLAGYALIVGIGLLNTVLVVFAADEQRDYVPISRVNPNYPAIAIEQTLEAWVQLQFTIDESGNVRDVVVLDNCVRAQAAAEESCTATGAFNDVSVEALSQWKYEPVLENGAAVSVAGIQTIMRYELGD